MLLGACSSEEEEEPLSEVEALLRVDEATGCPWCLWRMASCGGEASSDGLVVDSVPSSMVSIDCPPLADERTVEVLVVYLWRFCGLSVAGAGYCWNGGSGVKGKCLGDSLRAVAEAALRLPICDGRAVTLSSGG
ncbi:hypothetical protein Dimus_025130 [Dionaea muscipula]